MDISRFCLEVEGFQRRTGKTQDEVATAFGVSLPYLRNVLYRSKPLTIHLVEKAAPILGLTVHDFILGESSAQADASPRDESFGNVMALLGPRIPADVKKNLISIAQSYQPKGATVASEALAGNASANVIDAIWHDLSPEGQSAMVAFAKSLQDHNHREAKAKARGVERRTHRNKTG